MTRLRSFPDAPRDDTAHSSALGFRYESSRPGRRRLRGAHVPSLAVDIRARIIKAASLRNQPGTVPAGLGVRIAGRAPAGLNVRPRCSASVISVVTDKGFVDGIAACRGSCAASAAFGRAGHGDPPATVARPPGIWLRLYRLGHRNDFGHHGSPATPSRRGNHAALRAGTVAVFTTCSRAAAVTILPRRCARPDVASRQDAAPFAGGGVPIPKPARS